MPYTRLLNNIVAESNLSYKEIAKKCTEMGTKIDPSYISKLLAGKQKVPSEKISRAIARACNYDEKYLVIEGYVDGAPKEIKDILYKLREVTALSSINLLSDITNKETVEIILETIKSKPISEFLVNFLYEQQNSDFELKKNSLEISSKMENFTLELKNPVFLSIEDDNMNPIIPKNSEIIISIQEKYNNGDILAFKDKNNKINARYYLTDKNNMAYLVAISKNSKPIAINNTDIKILGKVIKIVKEI